MCFSLESYPLPGISNHLSVRLMLLQPYWTWIRKLLTSVSIREVLPFLAIQVTCKQRMSCISSLSIPAPTARWSTLRNVVVAMTFYTCELPINCLESPFQLPLCLDLERSDCHWSRSVDIWGIAIARMVTALTSAYTSVVNNP